MRYVSFFRMLFLPQSEEIDRYVGGKYVHKGMDGNYTVYEKEAFCNRPKCAGRVKIVPAPPREKHSHTVIGRCSLGPNLHIYTVDFKSIGKCKEINFRPLEHEGR